MTAKRLNEIMNEQHSYVSYNPELAEEYLHCGASILTSGDEDAIAWGFVDYLLSQDLADEVVE